MGSERVASCPLCSDTRREQLHGELRDRLHGTPGAWDLARCTGCGAAYLDPRPAPETLDEAYASYYTHETLDDRADEGAFRRRRRALRNGYLNARLGYELTPASSLGRFVVPLLPSRRAEAVRFVRGLRRPHAGARVLDVGCGNGAFLAELQSAGWTAEGVEPDPRAAAAARAQGLKVHQGTVESADLPRRAFHAVTFSHVLEHLHDPLAALRTSHELLRDDGVVWIATPNLASPGHARFGRAWRGLEPPRHLVLFTPSSLAGALERTGFRDVTFQRPASVRWVYEASAALAGRANRRQRLVVLLADTRSRARHDQGEELVVVAAPSR